MGRQNLTMATILVRGLLLTCGAAMALQMPQKYKIGGTALANTCGSWKYGTAGRLGEAVNPFCKSTEADMGTTGNVHLTAVPPEAHSFTQEIEFGKPNTYKMTTAYYSDAPCRSGEEFVRCPADLDTNAAADVFQAAGCQSCGAGQNHCDYTAPACQSNDCKCKAKCCKTACPKKTCMVDTHGQCPSDQTADCPLWPLCIAYGTCDSSSSTTELECRGPAGQRPKPCASIYPGCGAVNDYVSKGIAYPTQSTSAGGATGPAVNVMTIEASGTVEEVTDLNADGQVNSGDQVVMRTSLCGAQNNIFSFKEAGSADLLSSAAVNPTVTGQPNTQCCTPTSSCAANSVGQCECVPGHPTYCECSKLAKITLTSIKVTAKATDIKNSLASCGCATDAGSDGKTTIKELSACNVGNCALLSSIGYDKTSSGNAGHQTYYVQYFRPSASKNALYIANQAHNLTAALNTKIHSQGVYSLDSVCGACGLRPGLWTAFLFIVASALAFWSQ